jgi:dTDP-4-dehydrorhamnose 3,5-epimerase
MIYAHSAAYAPDAEGGVQALDPALGIDWPRLVTQRSSRDEGLPLLSGVAPL